MRPDQLELAAELLNMDMRLATNQARDMRDEIVCVSSTLRGLGSVLVGPDLSVLFFPSFILPEQALTTWDTGQRTPENHLLRCTLSGTESADR